MKNLKHLGKRFLAVLLVLMLCLGMLGISAFAANVVYVGYFSQSFGSRGETLGPDIYVTGDAAAPSPGDLNNVAKTGSWDNGSYGEEYQTARRDKSISLIQQDHGGCTAEGHDRIYTTCPGKISGHYHIWCKTCAKWGDANYPFPYAHVAIVQGPLQSIEPATHDVTLTYDANYNNGGKTTETKKDVTVGDEVTFKAKGQDTFTRTGYVLKGWADSSTSDTVKYAFGSNITTDKNKTVWAVWNPLYTHGVTYNTNGGAFPSGKNYDESSTSEADSGNFTVTSEVPTRAGYVFTGWTGNDGESYSANQSITVSGTLTLTAGWSLQNYTVRYFYETESGEYQENMAAKVTRALTEDDVKAGRVSATDDDQIADKHKPSGDIHKYDELDTVFSKLDFEISDKEDGVLKIYFKLARHTVTFNSKGGDAKDPQTVVDQGKAKDPGNPEKEGYVFVGWYTDEDCSEDNEWSFDDPVTDDMTLYAKWVKRQHTVTFDPDGGDLPEGAEEEVKVDHGNTVGDPGKPEREGYTFDGWYKDGEEEPWDFDKDKVEDDITLRAKWTKNTYTVTFESKGGTPVESQTGIEHGIPAKEPAPAPTHPDGYTFDGWYEDDTYTREWEFSTGVTRDMILYAKWIDVPEAGDLEVRKTLKDANEKVRHAGEEVTWTIEITNKTARVRYVNVTEDLKGGATDLVKLTYANGAPVGDYVVIPAGVDKTVTLIATYTIQESDKGNTIQNHVYVKNLGSDPDNPPTDLPDKEAWSDPLTVDNGGGIEVTKTRTSDDGARIGDVIIWTITVKNDSNVDKRVTLTEQEGVTFVVNGEEIGCKYEFVLKSGDSESVTATYKVKGTEGGLFVNVVTGETNDPKDKKQEARNETVTDNGKGVTLKKESFSITSKDGEPKGTAGVDDVITWTITVENLSNVEKTVTLEEKLEGAKFQSGDGITVNADGTCTVKVPAGSQPVYVTVEYIVTGDEVLTNGKLYNTVVGDTGDQPIDPDDPKTERPEATDDGTEIEDNDRGITVEKKLASITGKGGETKAKAGVGDEIKWEITVTNLSNVEKTVTLTEQLEDANLIDKDENEVSEVKLAPGASETVYATYTVTGDEVLKNGRLYNVVVGKTDRDNVPGEDKDGVEIEDNGRGIEVEKELASIGGIEGKTEAKAGETIKWTITVTNLSNVTKTVTLTEQEGVTFTDSKNTVTEVTLAPFGKETVYATYTVTEKTPSGLFKNVVTGTTDNSNDEPKTAEDESVTITDNGAGIEISKTRTAINGDKDATTAKAGETIEWTIKVTNKSNVKKTVTLTDEWELGTVTLSVDTVTLQPAGEEGATAIVKASYTVTEKTPSGVFKNVVVGKTDTPNAGDKETVTAEDEGTEITDNGAGIEISKTRTAINGDKDATTAKAGETIEWTIKVTNKSNVEKTVTLEELEGVELSVNPVELEPFGSKTVTATYTVKGDEGTFTNTVKGTTPEGDKGEDSDDGTPIDNGKGITVEKSNSSRTEAKIGDELTWTITVTNLSNVEKTVTLTELPGVELSAYEVTLTPAGTEGASATVKATYIVDGTEGDKFVNIVKADTQEGDHAEDEDNGTVIDDGAGISITKVRTSSADTAKAGDTITWEIRVRNNSNVTKTVTLKEKDGVTFVGGNGITLNSDGTCVVTLAPKGQGGDLAKVTATYTVTEKTPSGLFKNVVTGTTDNSNDEPKTAEDESVTITDNDAGIEISKTRTAINGEKDATTAKAGDVITWEIKVTNNSNVEKTVILTEQLDGAELSDDTVTLEPFGSETVTATYTVKDTDKDTLYNTVLGTTLDGDEGTGKDGGTEIIPTPDAPNGDNVKLTDNVKLNVVIIVDPNPEDEDDGEGISLEKTRASIVDSEGNLREDGTATVGDEITWEITVTNNSNVEKTVTLTEMEGVDLEQDEVTLEAGESKTVIATYVVTGDEEVDEEGKFVNTVWATTTGDDGENEDAEASDEGTTIVVAQEDDDKPEVEGDETENGETEGDEAEGDKTEDGEAGDNAGADNDGNDAGADNDGDDAGADNNGDSNADADNGDSNADTDNGDSNAGADNGDNNADTGNGDSNADTGNGDSNADTGNTDASAANYGLEGAVVASLLAAGDGPEELEARFDMSLIPDSFKPFGSIVHNGETWTCKVTVSLQAYVDAFNEMEEETYSLVGNQIDPTINLKWDAESEKWVLDAEEDQTIEIHVILGAGDEPGGNEPGGNEPGGNEPGGDEPGGDEPGGNNPGGDEPGGDEPGGDEPGGNNPGGDEPGGNNPGDDEPGGNNPGDDNTVDIPENDVPLTDIPEDDVPLTDIPEDDVPLTDIPEDDVPLTDIPEDDVPLADAEEDDLMDIFDEDVPLADVPQTGDDSQIWVFLALMSGAGLVWLVLKNKKREETAE